MFTLNEALKIAGLPQRADEAEATGGQSPGNAPRTDSSRRQSAVRMIMGFENKDGKDWYAKFDNDPTKLAKSLLADYKATESGGRNDSLEDTIKAVKAALAK